MLTIDGSQGEGGGQLLRSSLALSLALMRPFRMVDVRAKRDKPGLRPQHLACVRAAATLGCATVSGDEVGSREIIFAPATTTSGDYRFDIGTAGSTTMVLQTVLLPLMLRGAGVSRVRLIGGTHNPMAPSFDFIARTYLPALAKIGGRARVELVQHGFYPAGGGTIVATIQPAPTLSRLELLERGRITARSIVAGVANIPASIAERELKTLCAELGWPPSAGRVESFVARGGGNAVLVDVGSEALTTVFSGVGERGVRAEQVARRVAEEVKTFLAAQVPVDEHLADQLMLPLALGAGGSYRTTALSLHATTHIALIEQWTGQRISVTDQGKGVVRVDVPART